MPYIEQHQKDKIDTFYCDEGGMTPNTAGELNYQITDAIISYVQKHKLSYQIINDVIGALEGAKAEFQRRVVVPYEEMKIAENGDVYPAEFTLLKQPEPDDV